MLHQYCDFRPYLHLSQNVMLNNRSRTEHACASDKELLDFFYYLADYWSTNKLITNNT